MAELLVLEFFFHILIFYIVCLRYLINQQHVNVLLPVQTVDRFSVNTKMRNFTFSMQVIFLICFVHRGGNVLIVDFGTLRIESELQPKDVSLEVLELDSL